MTETILKIAQTFRFSKLELVEVEALLEVKITSFWHFTYFEMVISPLPNEPESAPSALNVLLDNQLKDFKNYLDPPSNFRVLWVPA